MCQSGCAVQVLDGQHCLLCLCPSGAVQLSHSSPAPGALLGLDPLPHILSSPHTLGSPSTPPFLPHLPAQLCTHAMAGLTFATSALCPSQTKTSNHPNWHKQGSFHFFYDTEYHWQQALGSVSTLPAFSLHVPMCPGGSRHKVTSGDGLPRGVGMCQPHQLMQTSGISAR